MHTELFFQGRREEIDIARGKVRLKDDKLMVVIPILVNTAGYPCQNTACK